MGTNEDMYYDYKIRSLKNTVDTLSALQDLITKPMTVLFCVPCNFRSTCGEVQVALISSAELLASKTIILLEFSKDNDIFQRKLLIHIISRKNCKESKRNIIKTERYETV